VALWLIAQTNYGQTVGRIETLKRPGVVDMTALRHLWEHLSVLGLVIWPACQPVLFYMAACYLSYPVS